MGRACQVIINITERKHNSQPIKAFPVLQIQMQLCFCFHQGDNKIQRHSGPPLQEDSRKSIRDDLVQYPTQK